MTNLFNPDMVFENHTNLPANELRSSSLREGCLNHLFRMAGTKPIQEGTMKRPYLETIPKRGRPSLETIAKKRTLKELYKELNEFTDSKDKNLITLLPHEMTRVSPFGIDSRRFTDQRVYDRKTICDSESWGRLTLQGLALSIFDEEILMVLLYLMKKNKNLYFQTSFYEICDIKNIYVRRDSCTAIWKSLEKLTGTLIKIETRQDIEKNRIKALFHLVDDAVLREGTRQIYITINKYFFIFWERNLVTYINLTKRLELRGDIAKALHRFLEGQSGFQVSGRKNLALMQVAETLNLESEERYTLRRQIKTAISELVSKKYLMQCSGINKYDTVFFQRLRKKKANRDFYRRRNGVVSN